MDCPFCHKRLNKDPDGYYTCYTDNCPVMSAGGNGASGSLSLWLKVIQMHNALEEIVAHPHGAACRNYARAKEALKPDEYIICTGKIERPATQDWQTI